MGWGDTAAHPAFRVEQGRFGHMQTGVGSCGCGDDPDDGESPYHERHNPTCSVESSPLCGVRYRRGLFPKFEVLPVAANRDGPVPGRRFALCEPPVVGGFDLVEQLAVSGLFDFEPAVVEYVECGDGPLRRHHHPPPPTPLARHTHRRDSRHLTVIAANACIR